MPIERPVRGPADRHAELHELLTSQNDQWPPEVTTLHTEKLAFARRLKNLHARSDGGPSTVAERGLSHGPHRRIGRYNGRGHVVHSRADQRVESLLDTAA